MPGTRSWPSSPRRASGCTRSSETATPALRPALRASSPSVCAADARVFLRADEGFFGQGFLAELERRSVTYAIGAPLIASMRARIGEVPEHQWQPSSYRTGSEVTSLTWKPKTWAKERRFVVRRDPLQPGEQLSLEEREWHYWALVTNDEERSADALESWHRAKANVENRIKEAKLGLGLDNLPSQRFHANWAYR